MVDAPSAQPSAVALAALQAFNARYPNVGADVIQLLKDLSVPLKDSINAAISADAPQVPLVRGWIINEGVSVADQTVDNFVNGLAAEIQTNGQ